MDSSASLGAKVRAARERAGLTQAQVGQPDFSASYVSAVELGKIRPSLKALEHLARGTGVALTDLLGADPAPLDPAAAVARALALIENAARTAEPVAKPPLDACVFTLRAAAQRLAAGRTGAAGSSRPRQSRAS